MISPDDQYKLTNRQREILEYMTKGHTNTEIGKILRVSENTVKAHIARIYERMDVTNRTEAAVCYQKMHVHTQQPAKPVFVLDLFSCNGNKEPHAADREDSYHLASNMQARLLTLLSSRKLFSVIKANSGAQTVCDAQGYCLSGTIYQQAESMNISIYLETYPQGIHIWNHTFHEAGENVNIGWIANKIVASLVYHLILVEASTIMALRTMRKNTFQNTLIGFYLLSHSTNQSILDAQRIFDSIIETSPSNIIALYGKGLAAYYSIIINLSKNPTEDYLVVKNCCTNIAAISKNCAENWYLRGLLSLLDRDRKGAIVFCQNALSMDSSLQEVYLMLAQLYTADGDYLNGKKYLEQGISLCPEIQHKGNNLVIVSIIHFGLERYDKAIELLERNAYLQDGNMMTTLLYICSLYHAGYIEKACTLSKDLTVNGAYLNRFLALADENMRNRISMAFTGVNISVW
jgi:DNA-binding CsgD family transcriptional regulator